MTALPASFTNKVRQSTCHVWIGSTNNKGYGLIKFGDRVQLAHRVAFEAAYGDIPEGYVIDHLCRVRNCVNPAHLQAVTQSENNRRGRAAKTLTVGDICINGHPIADEQQLYKRTSGTTECRECRRAGARRIDGQPRRRPTVRKSAASVAKNLDLADSA